MATMLVAPKPFYEIEGDMAASQQQQQMVEMNKIKIDQAKQQIADEQARKLDMQRAYQMSQQQGPGQDQQPDVTQLAGKTQPTVDQPGVEGTTKQVKDGTYMPSFMTGTDSEAKAKESFPAGYREQPQQKVDPVTNKPTAIEDIKQSKKAVDSVDQAIAINNNAIQLAYKRGDAAYAKSLLEENNDLKLKRADAEIKSLTATQKGYEVMGQIGNRYKGAYQEYLKNNPSASAEDKQAMSDSLWSNVLLEAQKNGATGEDLYKYVTPDQRSQYAEGLINGSEKASDMVRLKLGELQNSTRLKLGEDKIAAQKEKDAWVRQFQTARLQNMDARLQARTGELALKAAEKERDKLYDLAKTGDENATKAIPAIDAQIRSIEADIAKIYKDNKLSIADVAKTDVKLGDSSSKADTGSQTGATNMFKGMKQEDALAQAKDFISRNPGRKAEVEKLLKDAYPDIKLDNTSPETKPEIDSLSPSADVTPLPKKVDVTKRSEASDQLYRDPLDPGSWLTRKEYKKKYGQEPK